MKAFYQQLLATFDAETTKDTYRNSGIARPQYIDLYAGQDYDPQSFEANLFPAIFVNWSIDYKGSTAVANLQFSLCYEQLRDTSNLGKNATEALKFLDFIAITDKVLKQIESPSTGKLHLISEGQKLDDTVVDVYSLSYQCSYNGRSETATHNYPTGQIENLEDNLGIYTRLLG